ncbi:MAG: hypothetical protein QOD99_3176 [Chthoniobacter sp.]|jgi:hypothetical protein|nr:hypothetical protein [Chthoniobacter sp.]
MPISTLLKASLFPGAVLFVSGAAAELPESIAVLRHAGPLNVTLRTNAAQDVSLCLEPQYTTQSFGDRLTTEQIAKLDQIRAGAPDKFEILQTLFPRQIAEYLLRSPVSSTAAPLSEDPVQRLVLEIAGDYLSAPASTSDKQVHNRFSGEALNTATDTGTRAVLRSAAPYRDPDFVTTRHADTFVALQNQYSPYKPVGMSLVGDTLSIGGKVQTERLSAEALAAKRTPEQLAEERYESLCRQLAKWRQGQLTGNAYAGTIKAFLNDPRLATFTPEEIHRAYRRVFGRDLKIDLQADRLAAQLGHQVTYYELENRGK